MPFRRHEAVENALGDSGAMAGGGRKSLFGRML